MSEYLRAPFPWFGDAMAYAKAHVAAGILVVDDEGRIWRTAEFRKRTSEWKPVVPRRAENVSGKGYLRISLWIPSERRLCQVMTHRLVYEVLVGSIPAGLEVDHGDRDKTNNRPSNLEPVTGLENMKRSHAAGRTKPWAIARKEGRPWRGRPMITDEQRRRAREMRASGALLKEIANELGIAISHAHRITDGGAQ
jgi:hypothetical protein